VSKRKPSKTAPTKSSDKPRASQAAPIATECKVGRPSLYTPELVDAICERLATGEPLACICRDEGMPHRSTVDDWANEDSDRGRDVSRRIARAREDGHDAIAREALEIADDSRNDYIDRLADEGDERAQEVRLNGEHVQRSRLRVDTRLKLLAKWDPKRYGDKVQHADADGGKLPERSPIIVIGGPDAPH
jgi:hypothetical protein